MSTQHEHNTVAISEFHREKRSQRRQIFTLLFLGWLLCLLILQIHHPFDTGVIANFGDLNVVWSRFLERVLGPFTNPGTFEFSIDALGWIIGATATTLVALVFSGRNPLGMANEAQVMALDELLELLTLLVGTAAAATMWMALHNVVFLPADPDSGPKFFLAMLCLMLVIFSVVRQRDTAVQREIDEFHLTTSMRLHTQRWERMWGVSSRNRIRADHRKTKKLVLWWMSTGLLITLVPLAAYSEFTPVQMGLSAVGLVLLAVVTAALTALAVSLYRSNPHPGVGLAYALVLLVVVVLVVVSPLAVAAWQNTQVLLSLLGYFIWLAPSLLLIFRKPQSAHMTPLEYRLAARSQNPWKHSLVAVFDGARESAYWIELGLEARRQRHYQAKLARLMADEEAAAAAETACGLAAAESLAEAEEIATPPGS
ncbi:hypothetical protein JOF48_001110 [Arthrobacter stackebrandtii]|uniref:Uncharacterized protein n=1 Tax=Arthrobacter stackebrandtii TaxID=272161 RepID=A0ABS4YU63_9MICC|nr:hypothetical protein [Arthrobacter stackebrandtii]MBP2412311.1 hypothetical protein [Arthrobacter stackebrandtii]